MRFIDAQCARCELRFKVIERDWNLIAQVTELEWCRLCIRGKDGDKPWTCPDLRAAASEAAAPQIDDLIPPG